MTDGGISPLIPNLGGGAPPLMSLDYGPSVSSPLSAVAVLSPYDKAPSFGWAAGVDSVRGSLATTLSSPRVLHGINSPNDRPTSSAWSPDGVPDPLATVHHQQQLLLESKLAASAYERSERRAERERRKKAKAERQSASVQELARSMEIDRSKVAQHAFTQMMSLTSEAEESRRERWRADLEEKAKYEEAIEQQRERFHRRELDRQAELRAEKERLAESWNHLEKRRDAETDAERRLAKERERQQIDRLTDLQKQHTGDLTLVREELSREREKYLDAIHRLEAKFDETLHSVADTRVDPREAAASAAQIAALRTENGTLSRQLAEARDEPTKTSGKNSKPSTPLGRKKRTTELREWKLTQELDEAKRARQLAETATSPLADYRKEVQSLGQQLRDERERAAKATLDLQKEAVTYKERESAALARVALEKERYDTIAAELADAKQQKRHLEDDRRARLEEAQQASFSAQRAEEAKRNTDHKVESLEALLREKTAALRDREVELAERDRALLAKSSQLRDEWERAAKATLDLQKETVTNKEKESAAVEAKVVRCGRGADAKQQKRLLEDDWRARLEEAQQASFSAQRAEEAKRNTDHKVESLEALLREKTAALRDREVELAERDRALLANSGNERERAAKATLDLQKEAVTYKERESAALSRLALEKELYDAVAAELADAKQH
ncbi:Flagellar attachment zone protein 1 [Diplonema papillatum]|nr:Flagellar attachment zone protein 1 [Diplonema papillatum]